MNCDNLTLTPEQEQLIISAFNNKTGRDIPSITELVHIAFPDQPLLDGRSLQGRIIKALLVSRGLRAQTRSAYAPVDKIELTDHHKEFINSVKGDMTAVEMAKIIFGNNALTNLNMETRVVAEYLRSIQNEEDVARRGTVDVPSDNYKPPRSITGVLQRVDKFVFNHGIQKDQMTAQQKAGLEALLSYLNTFRFGHQINLYETQTARDLFESSFVRYTYDKPDLTEEEVDQYINVSHDNVAMAATQVRMERLSTMLDNTTCDNPDERARISMGLVESIGKLSVELNQVAKRQQGLLGDLKQKRSDRIAALRSANASILNLVQLWKEEKSRKKLIVLAEARQKALENAAHDLSTMEEIKARIMGIDIDEIVRG